MVPTNKQSDNMSISSCTEESEDEEMDLDVEDDKSLTDFHIDIPYDVYQKMKPIEVEYGNGKNKRTYSILKPGIWSNVIFDEFVKIHKLPCCFIFKRCKVYVCESAKHFLVFNATCKNHKCSAKLKGVAYKRPLENQPLKLTLKTKDTRGIIHDIHLKRNLNGEKRYSVGENLQHVRANTWRNNQIRKKCDFGDIIPPNIYQTNVLRKAKQEFRDQKLGIVIKNPILSLVEMKHTIPYAGSIHTISIDPVIVHYWSPYQMVVYKESKANSLRNRRLCIDATGSVVRNVYRTSQELQSSHIFLYVAVLNDGCIQVPVCQMLSEVQDLPTITYWLSQWIRAGATSPYEVVVDYSNALIGAVIRSFCCGLSKIQYCEISLKILQDEEDGITVPNFRLNVYVRLDIAHLIKMICRWKCFKVRSHGKIKEFYVRAIVLLIKSRTLEQFRTILTEILVIASSEYDGNIEGTTYYTSSEKFREKILKQIENDNFKENIISDDEELAEENEDTENIIQSFDISNNIDTFIKSIKEHVAILSNVQGDRLNGYFLPDLCTSLLRITKDFPLWTNVMVRHYKSEYETATSAPVEGYFSHAKNELRQSLSIIDRFVGSHLLSIEGELKMARSLQVNKLQVTSQESKSTNYIETNNRTNNSIDSEQINCDDTESNKRTDIIYQDENNRDIDMNSNLSDDSKLDFYGENDTSINSDKSDINVMITDELMAHENWRNKAEKPIKIKKEKTSSNRLSKYTSPCPDIRRVLNTSGLRSTSLSVIMNGNLLPHVKVNKKKMLIFNTCAFDSLLVAISVSYIDSKNYMLYIDDIKSNPFINLCKDVALHGSTSVTYEQRGHLLVESELFKISQVEYGTSMLDANVNINALCNKLLSGIPSSIQTLICSICNLNTVFYNSTIILNELSTNNGSVKEINTYLNKYIEKQELWCPNCKQISRSSIKVLQKHILLETDIHRNNTSNENEILVKDIPSQLSVGDER